MKDVLWILVQPEKESAVTSILEISENTRKM